jgi:hypothetical protein
MEEIGAGRHYETMVFEIGPEDRIIPSEIDFEGLTRKDNENPYALDIKAEEMHMRMCLKYDEIVQREENER